VSVEPPEDGLIDRDRSRGRPPSFCVVPGLTRRLPGALRRPRLAAGVGYGAVVAAGYHDLLLATLKIFEYLRHYQAINLPSAI
jgi:hypothetical protein